MRNFLQIRFKFLIFLLCNYYFKFSIKFNHNFKEINAIQKCVRCNESVSQSASAVCRRYTCFTPIFNSKLLLKNDTICVAKAGSVYPLPTKLQGGNVICRWRVCMSVHRSSPTWPLPMMHFTSPYYGPPSDMFRLVKLGPDPTAPPPTCSNVFYLDLIVQPPGHVQTCSTWTSLYSRQTCWDLFNLDLTDCTATGTHSNVFNLDLTVQPPDMFKCIKVFNLDLNVQLPEIFRLVQLGPNCTVPPPPIWLTTRWYCAWIFCPSRWQHWSLSMMHAAIPYLGISERPMTRSPKNEQRSLIELY